MFWEKIVESVFFIPYNLDYIQISQDKTSISITPITLQQARLLATSAQQSVYSAVRSPQLQSFLIQAFRYVPTKAFTKPLVKYSPKEEYIYLMVRENPDPRQEIPLLFYRVDLQNE